MQVYNLHFGLTNQLFVDIELYIIQPSQLKQFDIILLVRNYQFYTVISFVIFVLYNDTYLPGGSHRHFHTPHKPFPVVLDGYDKMCNAARIMSPLLFELQRGHMQQFALTWNLLNKRIYQRWVYWEVKDLLPECILKVWFTLPHTSQSSTERNIVVK